MKVIIRYTRLSVTPSAPAEVIRYLQTAKRKEENLYHEQRRLNLTNRSLRGRAIINATKHPNNGICEKQPWRLSKRRSQAAPKRSVSVFYCPQ